MFAGISGMGLDNPCPYRYSRRQVLHRLQDSRRTQGAYTVCTCFMCISCPFQPPWQHRSNVGVPTFIVHAQVISFRIHHSCVSFFRFTSVGCWMSSSRGHLVTWFMIASGSFCEPLSWPGGHQACRLLPFDGLAAMLSVWQRLPTAGSLRPAVSQMRRSCALTGILWQDCCFCLSGDVGGD